MLNTSHNYLSFLFLFLNCFFFFFFLSSAAAPPKNNWIELKDWKNGFLDWTTMEMNVLRSTLKKKNKPKRRQPITDESFHSIWILETRLIPFRSFYASSFTCGLNFSCCSFSSLLLRCLLLLQCRFKPNAQRAGKVVLFLVTRSLTVRLNWTVGTISLSLR